MKIPNAKLPPPPMQPSRIEELTALFGKMARAWWQERVPQGGLGFVFICSCNDPRFATYVSNVPRDQSAQLMREMSAVVQASLDSAPGQPPLGPAPGRWSAELLGEPDACGVQEIGLKVDGVAVGVATLLSAHLHGLLDKLHREEAAPEGPIQ